MTQINGIWACQGTLVHCREFARPEMLHDAFVVIDSHSNGGTILELHKGPNLAEESSICSRVGLDPRNVLRLQVLS